MSVNRSTIKGITEKLETDLKHQKKVVVLIGAGVSKSAGIPLASEIVDRIKKDFPKTCAECSNQTYAELMNVVSPNYRREIIKEYINVSKLNASHLYLASLVRGKYVDRILTTNFDPLAMKALALENIFPGVYDVATAQNFNPKVTADISIFHLHGQIDGYTILNTNDEIRKHSTRIKDVINESIADRTFIVIGYSGENDYVIDQLLKIKEYNNFLYWIGYKDEDPKGKLLKLFDGKHKGVHYLKDYDADSFFISLVRELKIDIPRIISKPFSYLDEVIDNIVEIQKNDLDEVSVEEVKSWIKKAKNEYEKDPSPTGNKPVDKQKIKKIVREAWQRGAFDKIDELEKLITPDSDNDTKRYFANLLSDCGDKLCHYDTTNPLYQESLEKSVTYFQKAETFNVLDANALNNWGNSLHNLGQLKTGSDAEKLYLEAIEKYKKVIELKPDYHYAWYNWGNAIFNIGQLKTGSDAEKLYLEAIEKYKKAIELRSDDYDAWNNWGSTLLRLFYVAVENKQAILQEAIECSEKANELKPGEGHYNLACAYSLLKDKKKAMEYLRKAKEAGTLANREHILKDKDLDFLRDDPEFKEFISQLKK